MRTRRLSYGRGTGPYIRARSGAAKISDGRVKQGAESAWDRITAPSLACRGRCPRLGEVREEWILTRLLSARGWEADRCSPWCQAIKHKVTHRPRPWASTFARIWFAEGPRSPGLEALARSEHGVKGTHPRDSDAIWQASARGPKRSTATR